MEVLVLCHLPVARLLLLPPNVTFLTLRVALLLVMWLLSLTLLLFRLLRLLALLSVKLNAAPASASICGGILVVPAIGGASQA
jgi:hypothetical protein